MIGVRRLLSAGAVLLAATMSLLVAAGPARALTIIPAYDSSIVNAPNAAAIESSINTAASDISGLFSNAGTVRILFKYAPGSFLGQSDSSFYFDTYNTVVGELSSNSAANPSNTVLSTALANLSKGNDANGANNILTTSAEFRVALGDNTATPCFNASGTFVSGCAQIYDGVITISSSQPIDFTRPVPAFNGANVTYDAIRIEEHEIDEVLGGGGAGTTLGTSDQATKFGILDLYRYSAPNTPSFTTSGIATSYFSVDGGVTSIVGFNQDSTGDFSDWGPSATACPGGGTGGPGFVQDAFSCNNQQADVTKSSPEFTMLEAMGYDPANASSSNITWDCSTNPDSTNHTGGGSATKSTACTQVVLGANTYTGGTTIQAGTLQLGNGGTTGSIVGNVADNGALAFDRSDNITFAGAISGGGSVMQIGPGTTTLTGANSYTGGTTISAGTLQLGDGGTTGSIIGNVVDDGTLAFNRTDDVTFSGGISGTGGLVKLSNGYLYLTGNSTYTGGTTISAGAIVLGNGGTSGSIVGNVTDNGRLYVIRSDTYTFGGAISGSGLFAQLGTGTTILTGNSNYAGPTVIANGTLQLGNGGTTGSIVGNVIDNGMLAFNRSDNVIFAGVISGTGALNQIGPGALTLVGVNTYTGGTTIAAGTTLQLGIGGTAGSIVGNVTDNGAFVFSRSDDLTFSGVVSGTGMLSKPGPNYLYLTGNNTYTGTTAIPGGAIVLGNGGASGSIAGNVIDNGRLYVIRSDTYIYGGIISGVGLFAQSGTGTTILTGNNTYTGPTVVANGTMQLGNGGTTGSIAGNVIDNGTLAFDRSDNVTFGGVISGTGGVSQIGTGTTTLTGANTYTGPTTVSAGKLQGGVANAFGSGSALTVASGATLDLNNFNQTIGSLAGAGNVTLGSATLTTGANNTDTTFSGTISGSGALTKTGTGYLYLAGNNTYTGITTISGGAIVLGNGGTSGSLAGNVVNNGRLYVIRSNAYTIGGTISGSGLFAQFGSGTTVLTANNTYTGPTVITNGTLEAATSNAVGTGKVALSGGTLLLDNGVGLSNEIDVNAASFIDVNGTDTATLSGALVGSAPFEKDGTGTLILNHDNRSTYSGNISFHGTLTAGVTGAFGTGTVTFLGTVLVLDDGIVISNPMVLADNVFVTQSGGSATISGAISEVGGPWGLTKQGLGTLVLSGADTYTGSTLIEAGTLDVEGSLASIVTVGSGSTLKGNGTIAGLIAGSGATVAPGASIGTLNVAGNVSFATGSNYQIELNPTQSDKIAATGTATLSGGIVEVLAAPGNYAPTTSYTILTAGGGVSGGFAGVTSNLTVLVPTLSYKPGEVDLTLAFQSLASFASTANEQAAAGAIDADRMSLLYGRVAVLPAGAMPAAFDAASGEIHASLASVLLLNGESLSRAVLDRLDDAGHGESTALWGRLFGSWGGIATDGNAASLDTTFSGPTIGLDVPVADNLRLGGEVGYAQAQGFAASRGSSLTADATHVGLYGGYGDGPIALKAGVIASFGNARTNRSVRFANFSDSDSAKQSVQTTEVFGEASYDLPLDGVDLTPFLDAGWIEANTGSFAEQGGADALLGARASTNETYTTLGARLATEFTAPDGTAIQPTARVGWMHAYDGLTPKRALAFETTSAAFTEFGTPIDRDQAILNASLVLSPLPNLDLDLGYDAILASRTRNNQLHANLAWRF